MARKRAPQKRQATTHRASWRGNLTFGLVSVAVEAVNALNREASDIHFHQLHATCHSRIHYEKVCPKHGPVSNDEIVSGYEYKGKYIEIDPEELDALRTERERGFTIDAFVRPETVDPLYFDGRMYYLLPTKGAAEAAYALISSAMEQEERYAIGTIVFSGKDQIALVRPVEGVLHMAILNYDAEIRPAAKVAADIPKPRQPTKQLRMAQKLIEEWSEDDFDFSKYQDTYRERVEELIESKVKGHEIVAPEEPEKPHVVSLMDALKKSLEEPRKKSKPQSRTRRRRSA